jgi:hypothetical protein
MLAVVLNGYPFVIEQPVVKWGQTRPGTPG